MCTLGRISIGKQLNFHSVSFDNDSWAFVSFDTFLVVDYGTLHYIQG